MRQRTSAIAILATLTLGLAIAVAKVGATSSGTVFVVNSNDDGPGSFRRAVAAANGDSTITRIQFLGRVSTVHLQQKVEFWGAQGLTIDGNGATLDGSRAAGDPAFLASGGADLTVSSLKVRNGLAEGIVVQVPPLATGTIRVALLNVDIVNNLGHGVLVNDQEDPTTQDGVQPDPDGSAASVDVTVVGSRFIHNGYSVSDRDGLRVNEGGDGDLVITVKYTLAQDNGADGIEVDERGAGDVRVEMLGTRLTGNGPFDPSDLDDGFDIDEYDDGSILGSVVFSLSSNNHEEGFDFNENNNGDLRVDMQLVEASGNGEEGIDLEEDDDFGNSGDLVTVMKNIVTIGNGDAADGSLKIREKETGNLDVTLTNILSANSFGSGIFVRESQGGSSVVRIERAFTSGNRKSTMVEDDGTIELVGGHGLEILESGAGDLTAAVSKSNSSGNESFGVFGDETGAGAGTVTLSGVTFFGNPNVMGDIGGTASFVILP